MKHVLIFGAIIALGSFHTAAADNLTGGDAEAGKQKSAACAACHGADGNSVNPVWPKLAGQHAGYTVAQLEHFAEPQADSSRFNALMYGQATGLSEQDRKDIAAYFEQQAITQGQADPALVERGEKIYRGGIPEDNVAACIACHGPAGKGNAAANYPAVASQHAAYLVAQLKAYKLGMKDPSAAGARSSDPNQMMRNTAANLSEEDMEAVAQYMQGLKR